ncbi:MAG: hypothetical protein D6775_10335 [Caldilineae bacterium]|nr:MAG: hypothetical protein D6775_10335 [Caldilineae bacterium]
MDWLLAELADLRRAEMETYVDAQHLERFPLLLVVAVTALVLFELIPERRSAVGWKERLIAARRRQLEAYRATGSAESELERAAAS